MSDIFNMADTWNAGGTTFTAVKMTVTDTNSAAGSLLMDMLVGTEVKFRLTKDGSGTFLSSGSGTVVVASRGNANSALQVRFNVNADTTGGSTEGFIGRISGGFGLFDGSGALRLGFPSGGSGDILEQRRSTNAQTSLLYGTYTDASNYRRVSLSMTTAGVAALTVQGAGTGASGNVLHISGLPTSNPGPGILWNNAGTPAIGT